MAGKHPDELGTPLLGFSGRDDPAPTGGIETVIAIRGGAVLAFLHLPPTPSFAPRHPNWHHFKSLNPLLVFTAFIPRKGIVGRYTLLASIILGHFP